MRGFLRSRPRNCSSRACVATDPVRVWVGAVDIMTRPLATICVTTTCSRAARALRPSVTPTRTWSRVLLRGAAESSAAADSASGTVLDVLGLGPEVVVLDLYVDERVLVAEPHADSEVTVGVGMHDHWPPTTMRTCPTPRTTTSLRRRSPPAPRAPPSSTRRQAFLGGAGASDSSCISSARSRRSTWPLRERA